MILQLRSLAVFSVAWFLLQIAWLAWAPTARAIPAFARRYETSCQTCHTVYPALTPFGDAFRRNGYRFPSGEDEDRSMDEPVPLGHEVHKDLFPNEVWPGTLPGKVPISVLITPQFVVARGGGADEHHGGSPAVEVDEESDEAYALNFRDTSFALMVGTPLGDHFSVFAKVEVNLEGEVALERPFIAISPLKDPAAFMIRVGAFEPTLYPFTLHRSYTGHELAYTTVVLGDNEWSPEPQQIGLELTGVVINRLGYSAGVVEGSGGPFNRDKDFYGRLEYKFGGMSLNGTEPTGYSRPWQEKSVVIGGSFYRGVGTLEDPNGGSEIQSDSFWRASGDVYSRLVNAIVTVGGFYQQNQRPIFADPESGNLASVLAQLDYIIWPWFMPTIRYEMFRQNLPDASGAVYSHRGFLGVNALLRANIALRLYVTGRIDDGNDAELEEVSLALSAAF
ncbi:MAG: hypothetical protein KJN97_14855 [Deltaproteobacteria bacterium]|nr:hypothetical protein [Deltaproteobacteria bacterium]